MHEVLLGDIGVRNKDTAFTFVVSTVAELTSIIRSLGECGFLCHITTSLSDQLMLCSLAAITKVRSLLNSGSINAPLPMQLSNRRPLELIMFFIMFFRVTANINVTVEVWILQLYLGSMGCSCSADKNRIDLVAHVHFPVFRN